MYKVTNDLVYNFPEVFEEHCTLQLCDFCQHLMQKTVHSSRKRDVRLMQDTEAASRQFKTANQSAFYCLSLTITVNYNSDSKDLRNIRNNE